MNIGSQLKAIVGLPGALKGQADAAYQARDVAQKAQVRSNQKNPMYGRLPSYKKGGTVKKTGLALVHKGEIVTPVSKAKYSRMKQSKGCK